jgi:putative ABC transport system substrate-binding protein
MRAQQATKLHRVGWLDYNSSAENLGTFGQALYTRGWRDGATFRIDYRGALGKPDLLTAAAADLVRLSVSVILAPGTQEALAAQKATGSIPIVVTGVDEPVLLGMVGNLARPSGNITGVASTRSQLGGKILLLMREALPDAKSAGVLWDTSDPDHRVMVGGLQDASRSLGLSLDVRQVRQHTEVEAAVAAIAAQGNRILVVPFSSLLVPRWIADLALKHGLALASTSPGYVYEGGLMTYTEDWDAMYDRTEFKLIINENTARTIGLSVPSSIAVRADHIIE